MQAGLLQTHGPPVLTNLPTEVYEHIATFLDLPSASRLARTCHSLQDIGEARLWADLDLPLSFTDEDHGLTEKSRPRSVTTKQAIDALRARPIRTTFVKRVSAMPTWGNSPYTHILLDLVKDSLSVLDLHRAPAALLSRADLEHRHLSLVQRPGMIRLPNLRGLCLPLNQIWWNTAIFLLAAAPMLECLTIRPAGGESDAILPETTETTIYPSLPNLRILKVEKLVKDYVGLLIHMIDTSPHLGRAILWTSHGRQRKGWWSGIADALRRLDTLWSLDVEQWMPLEYEKGGFEHIRDLNLKREYNGCWALLLDEIDIPSLPNLELLSFTPVQNSSAQSVFGLPPRVYPCVLQEPSLDMPARIAPARIPDRTLRQLRAAPKLRSISMPTRLYPPSSSTTPEVDQSREPGTNVVEQIRIARINASGDRFIWCRANSHKVRNASGGVDHGRHMVVQDWMTVVGIGD